MCKAAHKFWLEGSSELRFATRFGLGQGVHAHQDYTPKVGRSGGVFFFNGCVFLFYSVSVSK